MGKIRKNISIDEAIWKKLQELAKKENRSASNFIEYLIEKLEKGEQEMNEENTQVKITMPLIDDIELQNIDTFYNDIVSEYTKAFVKEKEQVIAQRLMMNLQKENTELKEKVKNMENLQKRIDKALDFIDCHFKEMAANEEAQELKSILKKILVMIQLY